MAVKIERGVPIPAKNAGAAKYPWDSMNVGESFVVHKTTNARSLCINANKTRGPKKFETRMQRGIQRVWRTK